MILNAGAYPALEVSGWWANGSAPLAFYLSRESTPLSLYLFVNQPSTSLLYETWKQIVKESNKVHTLVQRLAGNLWLGQ